MKRAHWLVTGRNELRVRKKYVKVQQYYSGTLVLNLREQNDYSINLDFEKYY